MEMKEFYYEDGLRVSVFNLDHKSIPYHWHSEVSDMVYCARGQITIELPDAGESYKLDPGQVYQVPSQNKHRFVNSAPLGTAARYVLLQIGIFDINFVPAAKELADKFAGKAATPVPNGVVYICERKNDILELAGRFEQQKPGVLTPEERDDVVRALRLLASNGVQSEPPRAGVRAEG
jgi:hypothetical protein